MDLGESRLTEYGLNLVRALSAIADRVLLKMTAVDQSRQPSRSTVGTGIGAGVGGEVCLLDRELVVDPRHAIDAACYFTRCRACCRGIDETG
jgi:hypothetical protein